MTTTTAGPIKSGRPRTNPQTETFHEKELYGVLFKALPQYVDRGRLSPQMLKSALGCHIYSVYRWLNEEQAISPRYAKKLVDLAGGRLKPEQLARFVIS